MCEWVCSNFLFPLNEQMKEIWAKQNRKHVVLLERSSLPHNTFRRNPNVFGSIDTELIVLAVLHQVSLCQSACVHCPQWCQIIITTIIICPKLNLNDGHSLCCMSFFKCTRGLKWINQYEPLVTRDAQLYSARRVFGCVPAFSTCLPSLLFPELLFILTSGVNTPTTATPQHHLYFPHGCSSLNSYSPRSLWTPPFLWPLQSATHPRFFFSFFFKVLSRSGIIYCQFMLRSFK